jgi:Cdc6-like AAA superfamily ATPase
MKYNPFKPGSIVHPGMFAGRLTEINEIEKLLFQTKNGNSSSFLIHGERGIGKSSLLFYIDAVARGAISPNDGTNFNFMVISVSLEPHDTFKDIIYKIAREYERELKKNEKIKAALKDVWEFITNWEIMGVKYQKIKEELDAEVMLEELTEKTISVLEKTNNTLDGIYIFVDEADKPSSNPNLGVLSKYMTERIHKKGIQNFGIGIIGISSVIEKIKESHESALRIFSFYNLEPLNPQERKIVIELGLDQAKEKNGKETSIDEDAKDIISRFSEGYPHFLQQYAYSAFEVDTDDKIDESDVIKGLVMENGALHQLGVRYFDNMYFKEIYSEDYRKILQVMAAHNDEYISKKTIVAQTGLKDYTVQNAITACAKKGILTLKPGSRGMYKLISNSFKVWILTFANAFDKKE